MKRSHRGVTLIELMVVVVIVAILASIAYPSYRQYAIRSNRTEAKTALLQASQALEKCYTRTYTYAGCGLAGGATQSGNYVVAIAIQDDPAGGEDQAYTITATPQLGQAEDTGCGTLAVDQTGRRFERTDQPVGANSRCW